MSDEKGGIRKHLLNQGLYIHFHKENWHKSNKNQFFKSFSEQKKLASKGMTKADRKILDNIRKILAEKQNIIQALNEFEQLLISSVKSNESVLKTSIAQGVQLFQFFATSDTQKLSQLIQSNRKEVLDNLIVIQNFLNSISPAQAQKILKEKAVFSEGELMQLSSSNEKLTSLIGQGEDLSPSAFVTQLKSFTGSFMSCITSYVQDMGKQIGNFAKSTVNEEVKKISRVSGGNTKIVYRSSYQGRAKDAKTEKITSIGKGAQIEITSTLRRQSGLFELTILSLPNQFPRSQGVINSSNNFKQDKISYAKMFNYQVGAGSTSGQIQNWFLNAYFHEPKSFLYSNSSFMNYLKGRAYALMDRSFSQKLFFYENKQLLTLDEMLEKHEKDGLLNKYIKLQVNKGSVPNTFEKQSSNETRTEAATRRSQKVYTAIKKAVSFTVTMKIS